MRRTKGENSTPKYRCRPAVLFAASCQVDGRPGIPENGIIPIRSIGSNFRLSVRGATNMLNRDLIRASEIGDWCFCRRAWYLNDRRTRPTLVQIEKRQALPITSATAAL